MPKPKPKRMTQEECVEWRRLASAYKAALKHIRDATSLDALLLRRLADDAIKKQEARKP